MKKMGRVAAQPNRMYGFGCAYLPAARVGLSSYVCLILPRVSLWFQLAKRKA